MVNKIIYRNSFVNYKVTYPCILDHNNITIYTWVILSTNYLCLCYNLMKIHTVSHVQIYIERERHDKEEIITISNYLVHSHDILYTAYHQLL